MKAEILFQHFCADTAVPKRRGRVDPLREGIPIRSISSLLLAIVNALDAGVLTDVTLHAALDGLPQELAEGVQHMLRRCPFSTRIILAKGGQSTADQESVHGGGEISSDFAKGSDADLVYITETTALHAPQGVEGIVADFQLIAARYHRNIILSPYTFTDQPATVTQGKVCGGKYRQWQTVSGLSRTFLMDLRVYRQIFSGYFGDEGAGLSSSERGQVDVPLEEMFAPHFPLALLMPELRPQYQGVWHEWYEQSVFMPPELWKNYIAGLANRQEKALTP